MPLDGGDFQNFRSVQDLLVAFYGGGLITQPEESDYTIGASTVALGAQVNGMRIGVLLSNTGATNIAVSFKNPLTTTTGIFILPGRNFRLDWYYDGDLVSRPLFAISSAGGGTLHMVERFLTGA
jgi:hypothetical protein